MVDNNNVDSGDDSGALVPVEIDGLDAQLIFELGHLSAHWRGMLECGQASDLMIERWEALGAPDLAKLEDFLSLIIPFAVDGVIIGGAS